MKAIPTIAALVTILISAGCELPEDSTPGGARSVSPPGTTGVTTTTTGSIDPPLSSTSATTGTGGSGPISIDGGIGKTFGSYDKAVVNAATPPPPISGGTLAILAAGHKAAVADSDRDQVVLVDLDGLTVTATTRLEKGDEPGRIVGDAAGRVHVALRGAGAIAAIDADGNVLRRTAVCNHPRGLAYDRTADVVHVACVGGELITLPAGGGAPVRTLKLDRDLRDIVIEGDKLLVSRFRAAELLVVEADGHVSQRLKPAKFTDPVPVQTRSVSAAVAWRTTAAPGGGALMVLQEEQDSPIAAQPGGYGRGCGGGIVTSVVSVLRLDGTGWTSPPLQATLPVDVAVSGDGVLAAVAGAGVAPPPFIPIAVTQSVVTVALPPTIVPPPIVTLPDGGRLAATEAGVSPICGPGPATADPPVVAVAFDALGRLVKQTREPALRVGNNAVITLPGDTIADTGHEIFHLATFGGLACASCHPEGREDGHTWQFQGIGLRRTQAIGGGILGTEPFHWDGDMNNFDTLAHQVFMGRMSGPQLRSEHVEALANWIDKIPAWKPAAGLDTAAVERGKTLFASAEVGCTTCHAGAKMTNNASVDIGIGMVQVPSLRGVSYRAPLMHSGCAATVADRFNVASCGGGETHGHTASLSANARADLIAYLESL